MVVRGKFFPLFPLKAGKYWLLVYYAILWYNIGVGDKDVVNALHVD